MDMQSGFELRSATLADMPALRDLHAQSWLELGGKHYNPEQIAGIMADIVTVDPHLIGNGTYYVIEHNGRLVASGGWSVGDRATLGGPAGAVTSGDGPAGVTIRAVFTAPSHARRGLAKRIMEQVERSAAAECIAERLSLTATLSGLPFYTKIGYVPERATAISLSNGEAFAAVVMSKGCDRIAGPGDLNSPG